MVYPFHSHLQPQRQDDDGANSERKKENKEHGLRLKFGGEQSLRLA